MSLYVSVSLVGGVLVRKIRHKYNSLWHHVDTSTNKAQAKLQHSSAHLTGMGDLLCIGA